MAIDKEDLTKNLVAIHVKLDLLWLLLGNVAFVEGFPQSYIDELSKAWDKASDYKNPQLADSNHDL